MEHPIVKNTYCADNNNVWLFRYQNSGNGQTQNIQRNEYDTLGVYPKFGFGDKNYLQGSISALLGSEIVLSQPTSYTERLPMSRLRPLSTNESINMLQKWRQFVFSKNPKLLKDIKGQSWIVHPNPNQFFGPILRVARTR